MRWNKVIVDWPRMVLLTQGLWAGPAQTKPDPGATLPTLKVDCSATVCHLPNCGWYWMEYSRKAGHMKKQWQKLDSENARTLLLEHYRVGKLTANILSLADGNSFTWEILSESTAAQQATDAGSIHLKNRLESEMSRGAVKDFEPQEFIGGVPQRLAEATGNTSTEDLDSVCEIDSMRREQFNAHESVGEVRRRLAEATGN